MSKVLYFLISFVLVLSLVGNVLAADIEWDNDNGAGDQLWDTAVNWDLDRVPNLYEDYDVAIMDDTYTEPGNGPIIQDGIAAECDYLEMGFKKPADEVVLTMTGGTLTVGGWIDVGGYNSGYFRFDMNEGQVNVIGYGDATWEGVWLGFNTDAYGVMNVSGGDLDIFGGLWIGWEPDSYGLFNITGGTYNGTYVYIGSWMNFNGAGRLDLHGGTMHCSDFAMGPVSHMDVSKGVLTCETNLTVANGWLFDPGSDTPISDDSDGVRRDAPGYTATLPMLVALGHVTAYGVSSGDIITDDVNYPAEAGLRALVKIDYDQTNAGMTTVWAAAVDPNLAYNPSPYDKARGVQPSEFDPVSWSAGTNAAAHDVYFGTDKAAVANADTMSEEYRCRQTETTYTPDSNIPYIFGTDYYWRIDEVNSSGVAQWPGEVWSFTATDHLVVDDFDSYADDYEMQSIWCDWYCSENYDSGAVVYVMTDSNFTYDDGNSMEFSYDNDYSDGSDAYADMADLGVSSNWLIQGAKALRLVFKGDAGNPVTSGDSMYVAVEDTDGDTGMVEYHDINDLRDDESWHEWHIDFEELMSSNVDLDLTDVSLIYLGISGSGSGYVYFDNIELWSPYCRWDISHPHGDFDGDCDIDGYDMGIMAQTWLMTDGEVEADLPGDLPWVWYKFDEGSGTITYNSGDGGGGLNGTFPSPSDPTWDSDGAPAIGSEDPNYSLYFDGSGDYVEIPVLNLDSNTVTISAWIKRDGSQVNWAGIVFSRDKDSTAGLSIGENLDLKYHWNGDHWWWNSDLIVPDNEWVFTAVVVEPTQATMYMNDGTFSWATNIVNHDIEEFDGITCVGWDQEPGSGTRFFKGRIDDVRIYTRSLDLGEIMGLSGLTGMQYLPLDVPSNIIVKDPPGGPYNEGNKDVVNLRDYAVMADNWLAEILWP